jgi:hypothetical protein
VKKERWSRASQSAQRPRAVELHAARSHEGDLRHAARRAGARRIVAVHARAVRHAAAPAGDGLIPGLSPRVAIQQRAGDVALSLRPQHCVAGESPVTDYHLECQRSKRAGDVAQHPEKR